MNEMTRLSKRNTGAVVSPRLGGSPPITSASGYPWVDGDVLYAADLDAAIANSAAGYSIRDYGAQNDGVTDDSAALNATIAAVLALPHGGKVILPAGRIVIASAIAATIPAGKSLMIEGMGMGASELYFSTATDGLSFKLANVGAAWGSVHLRSLTVTRGPTSPVSANIGINIWVDPTANKQYNGMSSLRDLVVWGSTPTLSQWFKSVTLSGVSCCAVDNVTIQAVNGVATDLGDVCLTVSGPSTNQYGVSYNIVNTNIVGGSCGILVDSHVQGVFTVNSTIIGQYDSVRINGAGPAINHTTSAATASGNVLHFAANSFADVVVGSIVNGTNIPPQARVSAVDNAGGAVTIGTSNVTGAGVASGAAIAFQPYYASEDVAVSGCSLNAGHRGVYATWGGQCRVIGTTILHFASGVAGTWAGIEFNEGNNGNVIANNILGNNTGSEAGIIFSSTGYQGTTASTCVGNTITSVVGAGVWLRGTTSGTTVTANNATGGTQGVVADIAGANAVLGNMWQGVSQDFTWQLAGPGTMHLQGGLTATGPLTATDGTLTTFNVSGYTQLSFSGADTVVGRQAASPATATAGYLLIPFLTGAPTGVPTNYFKGAALIYDTTNHKLWAYDNGTNAWRGIVLT